MNPYQRESAKRNEARILSALLIQPLTFTELHKATGLGKNTLSNHLKELTRKGLIRREYDEKRNRVLIRVTGEALFDEGLSPDLRKRLEALEGFLKNPPALGDRLFKDWVVAQVRLLKALFILALAPPVIGDIAFGTPDKAREFITALMTANWQFMEDRARLFRDHLISLLEKTQYDKEMGRALRDLIIPLYLEDLMKAMEVFPR